MNRCSCFNWLIFDVPLQRLVPLDCRLCNWLTHFHESTQSFYETCYFSTSADLTPFFKTETAGGFQGETIGNIHAGNLHGVSSRTLLTGECGTRIEFINMITTMFLPQLLFHRSLCASLTFRIPTGKLS